MKIWYGTLLVAGFILTGYLVFLVQTAVDGLSQSTAEMQIALKTLEAQLASQNETLSALQNDLKKALKAAEPAPKPQEDKGKLAVDAIRNSLKTFADADAKIQQGDVNGAVELLASTKKALWQAGDVLPTHQAALRGLMGPIDALIAEWKKGHKAANTAKITQTVRDVLQKIDSKFDT